MSVDLESGVPFRHYCRTEEVKDVAAFKAEHDDGWYRKAEAADPGGVLYVPVRYINLVSPGRQPVPLARVQENHRMLNVAYAARNSGELGKLPDTAKQPWRRHVGNPNVQFLPTDHRRATVEVVHISRELSGDSPVSDAASLRPPQPGVLNIYVGHAGGKTAVLGQARLYGNVVYVLDDTVGGANLRGRLPGYDMGKTLIHEVCHAIGGAPHTFTDSRCDGVSVFPDVPEQIAPNYHGRLVPLPGGGGYKTEGDNRTRAPEKSCLRWHTERAAAGAVVTDENVANYMDYGDDEVSNHFTKSQATMIRQGVLSMGPAVIRYYRSEAEAPGAGAAAASSAGAAAAPSQLTRDEGDGAAAAKDDENFWTSTGAIVLYVIGGLVVLLGFAFLARRRHSPSSEPTTADLEYAGTDGRGVDPVYPPGYAPQPGPEQPQGYPQMKVKLASSLPDYF